MIFDILRFNLFALDILKEEGKDEMSIGEYLDREGYGDGFKEDYLLVSSIPGGTGRVLIISQ
jgi:predicted NAD/FAD-binding protein